MHALLFIVPLGLLNTLPTAAWNFITPSHYCVASCALALDKVTFEVAHQPQKKTAAASCTGLYVESLFDCSAVHCSEVETRNGLNDENSTCISEAGIALHPLAVAMEGRTTASLANITRVSKTSIKTTNYTTAVVPDTPFFTLALETISARNRAYSLNWTFAWTLCGYWGLVVCIGALVHVLNLARGPSNQNLKSLAEAETAPSYHSQHSDLGNMTKWVRRRLLLPLIFGNWEPSKSAESMAPTRMEALLILLYVTLNIVFCFPGYHLFAGNLSWPSTQIQICKYIANRTGLLALANLPVIWIFAARNNPFLWLTGWPYSTYSQFHRWSARIATLQAVTHAICYSVMYYYQNKYISYWAEQFFWCGAIAVIALSFLLLSATHIIRKHRYDAFLLLHFSLAMVLLVCLYLHLEFQEDSSFFAFIWPCVAIWALDRALRLGRIVYCNVLQKGKLGAKAVAVYDFEADIIRLDVTKFFQRGGPQRPGCYFYIYEPGRLFGYESHPFTLCPWGGSKDITTGTAVDSETSSQADSSDATIQHTFLIRPRGGFTKHLRHKLHRQAKESKPHELTIILEGPYGQTFPLKRHSDILMITGGSGITAAVSWAHGLLHQSQTEERNASHCSARRLHIVWASQQQALVDTLCANELKDLIRHPSVRLDVYLTAGGKTCEKMSEEGSPYRIHSGRPDLDVVIAEAWMRSRQSLGVFCCGPVRMGADCRHVVTRLLGEGGREIEYYEQRFGW